jgi:hypothetical protein
MNKDVVRQAIGAFSLMAALFSCAGGSPLAPEQERTTNRPGQSPAAETPGESPAETFRFGVFTGLAPEYLERLAAYDVAVIDAHYYNAADIASLHERGSRVYAYLNIGSIEEFRPYYKDFEFLALGPYDGWDDEQWIDISAPAWRQYLVRVLAWDLAKKGVDGFFIDNTDLYYQYPEQDIYDGILDTLKRLGEEHGLPLIINGGDVFMKEALERKALSATTVQGVNQESVFTLPDLRTGRFGRQNAETSGYYQSYLNRCKAAGLDVFITEYLTEDAALRKQILDYCERNGFTAFIAGSLALDDPANAIKARTITGP